MSMPIEERLESLGHDGVLYIDKYRRALEIMKDNLAEEEDFIFYVREGDWRNEVRHCTVAEWQRSHNEKRLYLDLPPEDWWKVNDTRRKMVKAKHSLVSVHRHSDRTGVEAMVKWDDFDPTKMTITENDESFAQYEVNFKSMVTSRSCPGIVTKTDPNRGSMFHKGKLDEGAMGDLLDRGLEGATERAKERTKKYGRGFQKKSFGRRIANGSKRKRH